MPRVKWKRDRYYPAEYWSELADEVEVTRCGYITIPHKLRKLMQDASKLVLNCHDGCYVWSPLNRWTVKVPYDAYDHLSLTVCQFGLVGTVFINVRELGPYKE